MSECKCNKDGLVCAECGELLEEMKADEPGVFYMDEGTNSEYWRAQVNILWRDAPIPQRAICEAWLAWKEQG